MNHKLKGFAPILSAVLVVICISASLTSWSPAVYEIQAMPEQEPENAEETEKDEDAAEEELVQGSFELADGIYYGSGTGYAGKISVAVTIESKSITEIEVTEVEADDSAFFNRAKGVIEEIIHQQSLEVDVVSGATYSSKGIISAVKNALYGEEDDGEIAADSASAGLGSTTVSETTDAAAYKDGTYYGSATGFAGTVTVKVVIKDGKIVSISIVSHSDGSSYMSRASALLDSIINKQSTNVDTVSGATYSSVGLINAVRNALAQAAVSETAVSEAETVAVVSTADSSASTSTSGTSSAATEASDAAAYKDGAYYGSATGFAGTVTVKVVIEDGKIVSITIVSHSDGSSYMSKASALLDSIINKQSTNVDTVSGATYSSVGLINAVRNALAQAAVSETAVSEAETVAVVSTADSSVSTSTSGTSSAATEASDGTSGKFPYPDGTYYGTGEGFGGDITVAVVIKDQTIESVTIVSAEDETPAYFAQAEVLADAVVTAQSADLDVVSGATYSSEGILEAVKNALAAAKAAAEAESGTDSEDESDGSSTSNSSGGTSDESSGSSDGDSGSDTDNDGSDADASEDSDGDGNSDSSSDVDNDESANTGSTQVYADGTYTVTVVCNPDENEDFDAYNLTAIVTIEGDMVVSVEVSGDGGSANNTYINWAVNGRSSYAGVVTQILALTEVTESSVGEVDTVSRATCSSVSIKEACKEALRQAAAAQESAASSSDSVSAAALDAALKKDGE